MAARAPQSAPLAARLPFFYGWVIVAIAVAASFLTGGINNVAFSVLLKPMSQDLHWSRTTIAGAATLGTFGGGLLGPVCGRLADRYGSRLLIPVGALVMGIATLSASFITDPWQFYAAYVTARAVSQAAIYMVAVAAVTSWFYRLRPRVLGLVVMAAPLGSSVLTQVYQQLLQRFDWRAPFLDLGIATLVLVIPAFIFLRRRPEDVGLVVDGQAPRGPTGTRSGGASAHVVEESWTVGQAARSRALWTVAAVTVCSSLATGSLGFNLAAALSDKGLPPDAAAAAIGMFGLCGAVASAGWGILAERVNPRILLISAQTTASVAMFLLPHANTVVLGLLFAFVLGLSARGQQSLTSILIAGYFGRRSFGSIMGITYPAQMLALGLGPLVATSVFDLTRSYDRAFLALGCAYAMAALLALTLRQPSRPTPSTRPEVAAGT